MASLYESKADYTIAKSVYFPRVDLKIKYGPSRNTKEKTTDMGENSLSMTQTLFKFGGLHYDVGSSRLKMESVRMQYAKVNESVVSLTLNSFLSILQAQETLRVYDNALEFYTRLEENFQERYRAGISSRADAEKIDVSIKSTEAQQVVQREQVSTTKMFLGNIIQRDVDEVVPGEDLLFLKIKGTAEDSYSRALKNNFSIRATLAEIESAEMKLKSRMSDYLPSVGYELSAKDSLLDDGTERIYSGQMVVNWNLFQGFSTGGKVDKQKAVLHRLKADKRQVELDVKNSIDEAFNTYASAQKEYELAGEAYDTSVNLMGLYLSEFDLGIRTLLDLVSAREGQTSAALREVNARYARIRSALNVIVGEGRLAEELHLPNSIHGL